MEIWIRLSEGQNLKLRYRCFATFFCSDAVFVIFRFRDVAVWTVPQECPGFPYIGQYVQSAGTEKKERYFSCLPFATNSRKFQLGCK